MANFLEKGDYNSNPKKINHYDQEGVSKCRPGLEGKEIHVVIIIITTIIITITITITILIMMIMIIIRRES